MRTTCRRRVTAALTAIVRLPPTGRSIGVAVTDVRTAGRDMKIGGPHAATW
jgi:hypothetical protein